MKIQEKQVRNLYSDRSSVQSELEALDYVSGENPVINGNITVDILRVSGDISVPNGTFKINTGTKSISLNSQEEFGTLNISGNDDIVVTVESNPSGDNGFLNPSIFSNESSVTLNSDLLFSNGNTNLYINNKSILNSTTTGTTVKPSVLFKSGAKIQEISLNLYNRSGLIASIDRNSYNGINAYLTIANETHSSFVNYQAYWPVIDLGISDIVQKSNSFTSPKISVSGALSGSYVNVFALNDSMERWRIRGIYERNTAGGSFSSSSSSSASSVSSSSNSSSDSSNSSSSVSSASSASSGLSSSSSVSSVSSSSRSSISSSSISSLSSESSTVSSSSSISSESSESEEPIIPFEFVSEISGDSANGEPVSISFSSFNDSYFWGDSHSAFGTALEYVDYGGADQFLFVGSPKSNKVYVYKTETPTGDWGLFQEISAPTPKIQGNAQRYNFGERIRHAKDIVVITAPSLFNYPVASYPEYNGSGEAYIYQYKNGLWDEYEPTPCISGAREAFSTESDYPHLGGVVTKTGQEALGGNHGVGFGYGVEAVYTGLSNGRFETDIYIWNPITNNNSLSDKQSAYLDHGSIIKFKRTNNTGEFVLDKEDYKKFIMDSLIGPWYAPSIFKIKNGRIFIANTQYTSQGRIYSSTIEDGEIGGISLGEMATDTNSCIATTTSKRLGHVFEPFSPLSGELSGIRGLFAGNTNDGNSSSRRGRVYFNSDCSNPIFEDSNSLFPVLDSGNNFVGGYQGNIGSNISCYDNLVAITEFDVGLSGDITKIRRIYAGNQPTVDGELGEIIFTGGCNDPLRSPPTTPTGFKSWWPNNLITKDWLFFTSAGENVLKIYKNNLYGFRQNINSTASGVFNTGSVLYLPEDSYIRDLRCSKDGNKIITALYVNKPVEPFSVECISLNSGVSWTTGAALRYPRVDDCLSTSFNILKKVSISKNGSHILIPNNTCSDAKALYSSNNGSSYTEVSEPIVDGLGYYECGCVSNDGDIVCGTLIDGIATKRSTDSRLIRRTTTLFNNGGIVKDVAMSANGKYQSAIVTATSYPDLTRTAYVISSNNYGANYYDSLTGEISDHSLYFKTIRMSETGKYQLACSDSGLWVGVVQSNNAITWTKTTGDDGYGYDWGVVSPSGNVMYAKSSNPAGSILYRSENYGINWSRLILPTSINISPYAVDCYGDSGEYLLMACATGTGNFTDIYRYKHQ